MSRTHVVAATLAFTAAAVAAGIGARPVQADGPAEVVVRGIAIVDSVSGRLVHGQDIVVRGTHIAQIADSGGAVPPAKTTILGHGKFAIAGLVDTSVAASAFDTGAAQRLLAWGVTGIGDASADEAARARWRHELNTGRRHAPRLASACNVAAAVSAATTPATPDAVHDALHRLVAAGQSPAAALGRFTSGNARALCLDGVGRLAPGQSADLVVLTANPLADIRHTRQIDAVIFRGEVLTQAHLRMLARGTLPPPTPPGR